METAKTNCEHACRNTCATLERAIEKEVRSGRCITIPKGGNIREGK